MTREVAHGEEFVYRAPRGKQPHVVLLPGLIAGSWMWEPTMAMLAEHGYGYLTLARPLAVEREDVKSMQCWALELMDRCEIERAVIAGGSFGSHVALACALEAPERVEMLVLSGAPGAITAAQLGISWPGKMTRSVGDKVIDKLFVDRSVVAEETIVRTHQLFRESRNMLRAIRLMKECTSFDYGAALSRVEPFVLMIWGAADQFSPCAIWQDIALRVRDGAFFIVDECGHLPMIERPDVFNALLLEHLMKNGPAERARASG
jgi:2-hydroxy-6-oxonona-2,4-dienedioate hydrolase